MPPILSRKSATSRPSIAARPRPLTASRTRWLGQNGSGARGGTRRDGRLAGPERLEASAAQRHGETPADHERRIRREAAFELRAEDYFRENPMARHEIEATLSVYKPAPRTGFPISAEDAVAFVVVGQALVDNRLAPEMFWAALQFDH